MPEVQFQYALGVPHIGIVTTQGVPRVPAEPYLSHTDQGVTLVRF